MRTMHIGIYLSAIGIALHPCATVTALSLGSMPRQQAGTTIACEGLSRRGLLVGATATAASLMVASVPDIAMAEESKNVLPKVTSLVTLDLSISRGVSKPFVIELFEDEAPASAAFFSSLASGTLMSKCVSVEDNSNDNLELCQEYEEINVGYKGSQLWRLVPNKRLDFGRVDSMFASRIPPTFAMERNTNGHVLNTNGHVLNGLKPSTRGAVSVKRGGGAFEFTVTPFYNKALDSEKEDLVVVGRVAEDDDNMAFLDELNSILTRKDIVKLGDLPPLGSTFARACDFAKPDATCAQFKPLKKIIVTESSVQSLRT